ncbi:MAG TPA: hypothetical protein PKO06_18880 [Candidatus Ozemobacteraceae bacterium]|nr:hypothetical protein [Candidatus Ozemobacteraceae bacterium]
MFVLIPVLFVVFFAVSGYAQDTTEASDASFQGLITGVPGPHQVEASSEVGGQVDAEPGPRKMPLPRGFDFWQKERDAKAIRGWEYAFDYSGEFLHVSKNHDGKTKQVYLDNLNLKLGVDLEKAQLGAKGRFFLYVLGNSGGNITGDHLDASGIGRVGDLQTLSNIETNETFRLYEAVLRVAGREVDDPGRNS